MPQAPARDSSAVAIAACAVFFLSACLFLSCPGVYNDEALFSAGIWQPKTGYQQPIGSWAVPLMVMSYVGALKAWLFAGVFLFVDPGPATTRLPMIIVGVATIYLSYRLMDVLAGRSAAVIGSVVLATDPMFVVTTTLDWGPVALQHCFFVAGLLALACFYRFRRLSFVFTGFLCFGLGLWDKALFAWNLLALLVAAIVTFPTELRQLIRLRTATMAGLGLSLGGLPLIVYNAAQPWATFQGNTRFSTEVLSQKILVAIRTLDSSLLFGWLTNVVPPPRPGVPKNVIEYCSVAIADALQWPVATPFPFLLMVSLFASVPVYKTSRGPLLRFLLFAVAFAWLQMAFNAGTGTSAHHVVLLWPLPHFVFAIVLAAAMDHAPVWGRRIAYVLTAWLVLAGLVVTNTYHAQLVRNGPAVNWTESSLSLSRFLLDNTSEKELYVTDWGILEVLRLLGRGKLTLRVGDDLAFQGDQTRTEIARRLTSSRTLFVGHVKGRETFPGTVERLNAEADRLGYKREIMQVVQDRFGREIFEVYQYRAVTAAFAHVAK